VAVSETKDLFLPTLWDILSEQAVTIKTQMPRLLSMLQQYWGKLNVQIPDIRRTPLEKVRFMQDIPYRIECIRNLQYAMNDGYFVIKALVDALFNIYINENLISEDFNDQDAIPVSFLISEQFVGSLLQFIVMDKTPIPMGFFIIAKNKMIMKLKGRSATQIREDLEKNGFNVSTEEINNVLHQLLELGYINAIPTSDSNDPIYKFVKEFTLTPDGQTLFQKKVKPLIEWAVELWRSLYNIRSIDTIIPDSYPFRDYLVETVKRAATQGFATAINVIENIGNYYQECLTQNQAVP